MKKTLRLCTFTLAFALALSTGTLSAQETADSQEIRIGDDPNRTYFLIKSPDGKSPPSLGNKLLLVLPGGSGSADFHPFVKNISAHALDQETIVAQLVSVRWTPNQQIIWPTKKSKAEKMKFSTEDFIEEVIKDVSAKHKIDKERIYTLSWSSGGPAAYAASLENDTIAGSFVAMSVFRPEWLGNLSAAKGHRYYLYHSPEDATCPYSQAEQAVKELTREKAIVRLETYNGGHGWHGNVFGAIRSEMEWLQSDARR